MYFSKISKDTHPPSGYFEAYVPSKKYLHPRSDFNFLITGNFINLKATCDDKMTVYVDGGFRKAPHLDTRNIASTIVIPDGYEVIAIKCENIGGGEGLRASAENYLGELVLLSDSTWKCSTVFEEGWNVKDFQASSENWESASDIGEKFESVRGQISSYATWIWTKESVDTIYCRTEYPWKRGSY